MMKTLLKKQLLELNQSFFSNRKTGKARSRAAAIGMIGMFGLLMLMLAAMFFGMGWALRPLFDAGLSWLYFLIMSMLALLLGVLGSVFNTFSSLYQAKDNDLLLSLPIPVPKILVARLLGVYLMDLMYSGVVLVPALAVYFIAQKPGLGGVLCALAAALLLSIVVLCLSCGLGWVVARMNSRLKNKSLLTVLVSVVFMGLYYSVCFRFQELLETLVNNAAFYGEMLRGGAYPLYLFGCAGAGDGLALLKAAAVILGVFALVCAVMSRSFLKLATGSRGTGRREYRRKPMKVKSVSGALMSREWRRYLSSATYMLNCSLGSLFMTLLAAALFIKGREWLALLTPVQAFLSPSLLEMLACAVLCLTVAMNDLTAPSVSLEGKSLWLAQSLPVTPWQVLQAKLKLSWMMTGVPALLGSLALLYVLQPTALTAVWLVILPQAMCGLCGCLGLVINLKAPNLHWTSETAVVKQSAGVVLGMLGGWVYVIALGALYYALRNAVDAKIYLGLCTALTLLLGAACLSWLRRRGARIFAAL